MSKYHSQNNFCHLLFYLSIIFPSDPHFFLHEFTQIEFINLHQLVPTEVTPLKPIYFYQKSDLFFFQTCFRFSSVISSVTQLCLTSCNCMNCRMPGFLVHHQLLEHTQTHVHSVSGAIQPAHPLSPPCPTFNLFKYQSIFKSQFFASDGQRFGSSASASILPMNIQD